jgi:glycosyltransferase domain-containing protein
MPRLTVVLPLKGRYPFTLRFLWYANRARLPYHFLVVDGQVHSSLAAMLDDCSAIFPNITVEYVRYPDDTNLNRFYCKMADALARVRTPYAMLADNDDFMCASGTDRALDFLQGNEDYVAAAGSIIGFSTYSGLRNSNGSLTGCINRLYKYFRATDATSPLVAERLRRSSHNLWIHYAVYRTEALATICREIAETDFSDLLFYEAYYVMRALTLGKIRLDDSSVGYARQYGTSLTASRNRNWTRQLVRGRFTHDVHGLVDQISSATALADGCQRAEVDELAFDLLEAKFTQFLHALFGSMQEVKRLLRERAPGLVAALVNRPRVLIGRERAKLLAQLTAAGASSPYLDQFRTELAGIEDVVAGGAFANFVRPYLPELHGAREAADHRTGQPLKSSTKQA